MQDLKNNTEQSNICVIRDPEGKNEAEETPEEIMNKNFLKQIKNNNNKNPPNHSSKTPGETQAK